MRRLSGIQKHVSGKWLGKNGSVVMDISPPLQVCLDPLRLLSFEGRKKSLPMSGRVIVQEEIEEVAGSIGGT